MTHSFADQTILNASSLQFLAEFTEAAIDSARVCPGECVDEAMPLNLTDYTLIRPGGRSCYPAVWTQDYAITLATGFVTPQEMKDHLFFIGQVQNGAEERRMESGAVIPPYAIPDHVLFDGRPVFYPGTYSSGEDQGGEPWGIVPPSNNHYDFILMAWQLWQATGDSDFLLEDLAGLPVIERLRLAFAVPRTDPANGLVYTEAKTRAVGFIFCDSIYMTGHLLFASLLRWRAAHHLAEMEDALDNGKRAECLRASALEIADAIPKVFGGDIASGGWLIAATDVGRQPDVWGTIYALYLGVLQGEVAQRARDEIVTALEEGTICYEGGLRHVPTNHDATEDSAWECTPTAHNTYQNGAYWHTPTGWLIVVLSNYAPTWAKQVFDAMIAHFKQEDFRKGEQFSAPWECFGKNGFARQNPVFLGSVAVPYGVLKS